MKTWAALLTSLRWKAARNPGRLHDQMMPWEDTRGSRQLFALIDEVHRAPYRRLTTEGGEKRAAYPIMALVLLGLAYGAVSYERLATENRPAPQKVVRQHLAPRQRIQTPERLPHVRTPMVGETDLTSASTEKTYERSTNSILRKGDVIEGQTAFVGQERFTRIDIPLKAATRGTVVIESGVVPTTVASSSVSDTLAASKAGQAEEVLAPRIAASSNAKWVDRRDRVAARDALRDLSLR